jgi:membrane protease YdiL (CAAX protease family)
VEAAAFRCYRQGQIDRRYGLAVAILVTGTMFAAAHLDFVVAAHGVIDTLNQAA